MLGLGNIVNTIGVLFGGTVGLFMKKGISEKMQKSLTQALGMCTIFIGISGALQYIFTLTEGSLEVSGIMMLIVSMLVGTVIGELIDIERRLDKAGEWLKTVFRANDEGSRFTEGFVTTSLVICVGAMAVVGGIQDGLGDPSTLFAKTVLDTVIAVIFASTLGVGVLFSAIIMFLYQGIFNVLGMFLGNFLSQQMLSSLSIVGNVLIFGVGVNLAFGKRLKVGNMLPALVVAVVWNAVAALL